MVHHAPISEISTDTCPIVRKPYGEGYRCDKCQTTYANKPPSCVFWLRQSHPHDRGPGTNLALLIHYGGRRSPDCLQCTMTRNAMNYYGRKWCWEHKKGLADDISLRTGVAKWIVLCGIMLAIALPDLAAYVKMD